MDGIIKSITEAESKAAQIKAEAQAKSAQIAAQAEERSAEIGKLSQAECKTLREKSIKSAYDEAQKKYDETLAEKRAEASVYAEKCLKKADKQINDIVRRVTGGSR